MRNGVIGTGMLALALLGSACAQGGKATPESQGGGGPYRQPTTAPSISPPPMASPSGSASVSPSVSASVSASAAPSVSASVTPPTGPATVDSKSTSVGVIVVDGKGRTLYLFENDQPGKPTCTGACAKEWPPFLTEGKPVAGSGVKADWLGAAALPDGKTQVTYNGAPLYYYAGDTSPGELKGHGVSSNGGKWYVVSAETGKRLTK